MGDTGSGHVACISVRSGGQSARKPNGCSTKQIWLGGRPCVPPWGGRDLFRAHHAGHVALTATGRGGGLVQVGLQLGPQLSLPQPGGRGRAPHGEGVRGVLVVWFGGSVGWGCRGFPCQPVCCVSHSKQASFSAFSPSFTTASTLPPPAVEDIVPTQELECERGYRRFRRS